jgi:TPR repeat protein
MPKRDRHARWTIQGEGGPKRPAQRRRYLERAAALGQIDALKVLAWIR